MSEKVLEVVRWKHEHIAHRIHRLALLRLLLEPLLLLLHGEVDVARVAAVAAVVAPARSVASHRAVVALAVLLDAARLLAAASRRVPDRLDLRLEGVGVTGEDDSDSFCSCRVVRVGIDAVAAAAARAKNVRREAAAVEPDAATLLAVARILRRQPHRDGNRSCLRSWKVEEPIEALFSSRGIVRLRCFCLVNVVADELRLPSDFDLRGPLLIRLVPVTATKTRRPCSREIVREVERPIEALR